MILLTIAAALAAGQPAGEPAQPDLDWLAGYWLSCEDGVEVAETWSQRRGGIMLGGSITVGDDAFSWEQARIEAEADGLVFHAQPRGQPAAAFRLVRSGPGEAVFENPDHDFPQRVIYRRDGDRLTGRIEGTSGGTGHAIEWHYRTAPLNARCGD
jgi:Domain of unknown function (DUF6265)